MTRRLAILLPLSLALTACGTTPGTEQTLEQRMLNPLYAERYYDEYVDHLADLIIQNDPITLNDVIKRRIDENRLEGLRRAQDANNAQAGGMIGNIMSETDDARGEVMLKDGVLYTDPSFETAPGIDLRVYLSSVLDPRDGMFPDESAVDLGAPLSIFGAQAYDVPPTASGAALRTFVLFDRSLDRMHGFAQLQPRD